MSDNHNDSKFLTGFLLGVLVGVLISLGAGGTFVYIRVQGDRHRAMEAMMEADRARAEAAEAEMRARSEAAKRAAEKAKEGK